MSAPDRADLWLPTAVGGDEFVGPYRVIRKAGSGGMGVVYLAVDRNERPVAVKVLRDHVADHAEARARLRRELLTMRRVHDRYIAEVVDADLESERPYIVSEFVDGPQLDDYIDEVGPLSREGLVTLGRGLLCALDAIHAVGVVHRDLKPGNVLLEGHRPVVIDFGIAQLADETRLTMTGLFVGTPGYVAPETINGGPVTAATDLWAWAAVLGYAATGSSLAGKGPVEVVLDRIRRGEMNLELVDADLRPLLQDCLAVRAEDRPQLTEIRARFDRYAAGGSTGPARATAPRPVPATHQAPSGWSAPGTGSPAPVPEATPPATTAVLPQDPAQRLAGRSSERRPAPALRRSDPAADGPAQQPGPSGRAQSPSAAPPARRPAGLPVLASAALLTAAAMSMPVAAGILLLALLASARAIDGFTTGVRWRQELGSSPARARLLQALASPWLATRSLITSLVTMLVPGALAVGTVIGAHQLVPQYLGATEYTGNIAIGAGAAVALVVLWIGPGSRGTRTAVHRSLRAVAPSRQSVLALTAVLMIATAAIALVVYRFPVLDWWPLPTSPTRGL